MKLKVIFLLNCKSSKYIAKLFSLSIFITRFDYTISGPDSIKPGLVEVALTSLLEEVNQSLPPLNWAALLSPLIRLGFGEYERYCTLWCTDANDRPRWDGVRGSVLNPSHPALLVQYNFSFMLIFGNKKEMIKNTVFFHLLNLLLKKGNKLVPSLLDNKVAYIMVKMQYQSNLN